MLSLPRPSSKIPAQISLTSQHYKAQFLLLSPIKSSNSSNSNKETSNGRENASPPSPPPITPPKTVEIKFRRGSKKRRNLEKDGIADGPIKAKPKPPKDWESMNLTEKAVELYMGEKGLLFWLNKFAYASIFIIIGGWIVFRFVGPALNIYQLDSAPLAPTAMFKG